MTEAQPNSSKKIPDRRFFVVGYLEYLISCGAAGMRKFFFGKFKISQSLQNLTEVQAVRWAMFLGRLILFDMR